jgi:hypothetical protein
MFICDLGRARRILWGLSLGPQIQGPRSRLLDHELKKQRAAACCAAPSCSANSVANIRTQGVTVGEDPDDLRPGGCLEQG